MLGRRTIRLGAITLGAGLSLLMAGAAAVASQSVQPASGASPATAPALYSPDGDAMFAQPYVDVDEWRDTPVRHRYVHGGFKGTDTRFSFYFPEKTKYQGRFFQHVTPTPDNENLAQLLPVGPYNKIGFSIASGAYFVETNGGGKIDPTKGSMYLADYTITAYRANAAAAAYSRKVALEMYGGKRPYGYAYGGSGGGYRTIGLAENTTGVWDGFVPYVIGSSMAIPNMFTVRMQALRVLRDKFPQIVDALEPGGSGNPYAGLNAREAAVLHEIERMGFPMKSWFGYKTMGLHGFAALYGGVALADPTYFADFWTKPGYLGFDHPEYFTADRIQFKSTVRELITARKAAELGLSNDPFAPRNRGGVDTAYKGPPAEADKIVAVRLAEMPPQVYFLGGDMMVSSGSQAGQKLMLNTLEGDVVMLGFVNPAVAGALKVGDEVTVDNSNFLAMETYHRHQVPGPDFAVWDQFRDAAGKPLYPQRPALLGPMMVKTTSGSVQSGKFAGKMIVVASLWDREAMPWQADWYRQRVAGNLGAGTDGSFRLYYTDHALHGDEPTETAASRIVPYVPQLQQALRDLAAWVERGVPPLPSTRYRIADGQVIVPATAAARRGIQPVVTLSVAGGRRIEVKAGQSVRFAGTVAAVPGGGTVVAAEWDFDGSGKFANKAAVPQGRAQVALTTSHVFDKPGTYFVGLRGASQRQGDAATPFARLLNLDRVRVVVK